MLSKGDFNKCMSTEACQHEVDTSLQTLFLLFTIAGGVCVPQLHADRPGPLAHPMMLLEAA